MKKTIVSMTVLLVVLVVVFTSLEVLVHTIPHRAVAPQIERSLPTFDREGAYPNRRTLVGNARMDNFTDCYMLNVAWCADSGHPVDAAMRNYRYRGDADMIVSMHQLVAGDLKSDTFEYGKYWHGYQVTLRPLLALTDYAGIRLVNGVALAALMVLTLALMWRRVSPAAAVCLIVSMVMMRTSVLPWSLQYSTCYYVMLAGVSAILLFPSLSASPLRQAMTLFAIGAFTSFIDFFTAPVMTLGVPLVILGLTRADCANTRRVLVLAAAWMAGYGLTWAAKWAVAWLLAGYNPLAEVADSVEIHSVGADNLGVAQMWLGIVKGWLYPTGANLLKFAILGGPLLAAWIAPRGNRAARRNAWLPVVAMLVVVWVALTTHHSFTHANITSRVYVASWFATLCYFHQIIDTDKLKRYVHLRSR